MQYLLRGDSCEKWVGVLDERFFLIKCANKLTQMLTSDFKSSLI